jgi:hypothetical protein
LSRCGLCAGEKHDDEDQLSHCPEV